MSDTTEHAIYDAYLRGRTGDLLERDQREALTLSERTAYAVGMADRDNKLSPSPASDVLNYVASVLGRLGRLVNDAPSGTGSYAAGSKDPGGTGSYAAAPAAPEPDVVLTMRPDGLADVRLATHKARLHVGELGRGPHRSPDLSPLTVAFAPQPSAAPEPATAAATTTEPWRPLASMHGKAHRVLAEVERSLVELRDLEAQLDRAWQAAANVPPAAPEPATAAQPATTTETKGCSVPPILARLGEIMTTPISSNALDAQFRAYCWARLHDDVPPGLPDPAPHVLLAYCLGLWDKTQHPDADAPPPEAIEHWVRSALADDYEPEPPQYDDGPGPEPWQRAERKAGA